MSNNISTLRMKIAPSIDKKTVSDPSLYLLPVFLFLFLCSMLFFFRNNSSSLILFFACIIIGIFSEVLSMCFHEIGHRTKLERFSWQLLLLYCISIFNLTSPHFWIFWHNAHHKTSDRWTAKIKKIQIGYEANGYPGLRRLLGPFELFIYKFFHLFKTKINFILNIKSNRKYLRLKKQVILDLLYLFSVKLIIFFALPTKAWLFLELLPLFLQSFLSSVFVVTQHSKALEDFLKPKIPVFSVRLSPFLDQFFLCSGLHFEHHLFPNLVNKDLNLLNLKLKNLGVISKNELSMWTALRKIYYPTRTTE